MEYVFQALTHFPKSERFTTAATGTMAHGVACLVCVWTTLLRFRATTSVTVAVRQHVQACFDREAVLTELGKAATTIEELEQIEW